MEATITNLGLSHATATRDDYSGVVTVHVRRRHRCAAHEPKPESVSMGSTSAKPA